MTWYTVYNARTDEVVAIGCTTDCAKTMGRSLKSFWSMIANVKAGRNRAYIIAVEDTETNDYQVYGQPAPPDRRRRLDEARALELYRDGLTDEAIAAKLGVRRACIFRWRKKRGLPANGAVGRIKT